MEKIPFYRQNWLFLGNLRQNFYFTWVSPYLNSFLGSVLTIFFSRTHHSPWASMSQLIFLKMTKYTILGPKLAVYGLTLAKLLLCLSFAAPKVYSWDLFWLLFVAKLITVHKQAWAIPFYSNFASFCVNLAKNEGHISFFWSCESTFQLFFINLDVFLWPKEHKMHLESPNQFFWTFEKKLHFLDFLWPFF